MNEAYPVDWSKAPDWAKYWAVDSDGTAWWCEFCPEMNYKTQGWATVERFDRSADVPSWNLSIQTRPAEDGTEGLPCYFEWFWNSEWIR